VRSHPTSTTNETRKIGDVKKEKNNKKGVEHKDFPGGTIDT